jgi:Putative zinc-binding metallo-peptidase
MPNFPRRRGGRGATSRARAGAAPARAKGASGREWTRLPDEKLLDWRLRDLHLTLEGSALESRIARLNEELRRRGLRFRPHFWISDNWFSPDGVPGVAIPFFVAHPRLRRLEEAQMLEVEGGTEEWCMRLLRHETGHAIDNAYRLHRRKDWRQTFGNYSQEYSSTYQPRPYSKRFVLHLDYWYAQSHPAEDFAETFAVWLRPGSQWRHRYAGWPALRKLEYVNRLMKEIAEQAPAVRLRERTESIDELRITLRQYYARKRRLYGEERPDFYDRDLRRLFSPREKGVRATSAARFLRRMRPRIRRQVARWTGEFQYTIDQVLAEMIERAEELDLVLAADAEAAAFDATIMLTVQTMNYLHGGHHRLGR